MQCLLYISYIYCIIVNVICCLIFILSYMHCFYTFFKYNATYVNCTYYIVDDYMYSSHIIQLFYIRLHYYWYIIVSITLYSILLKFITYIIYIT